MSTKKRSTDEPLPNDFTEKLVKKIQRRQTYREFLFMIAIGFTDIVKGFFRIDTVKQDRSEKDTNK